jgi:AGZA family xanthine/uracil permease-like MFS transporter
LSSLFWGGLKPGGFSKKWGRIGENGGEKMDPIQKYFGFAEKGTNYKREIIGGLTTFLAMAYILFVNPDMLKNAGMDQEAVFVATALAAAVGTLVMGLYGNYPIAQAPGMGLNAFFTFSVVLGMGIPWQTALAGVFCSGLIFFILTLTKIRETIINAIPFGLKMATGAGIGLFIAFIGFKNAGIIVINTETALPELGNLHQGEVLLSIFGLIITSILMVRKVSGGVFFGMLITAVVGMIFGLIDVPNKIVGSVPSIAPTFFQLDFSHIFTTDMLVVIFTFLFVDFFDTAGTVMAVAAKAGLLKDNKLERAHRALTSDAIATMAGAVLGTSTTTSYIESASGVASGARTGFASVITAILFILALFFSPLLGIVTSAVTAPALIIVGVLMASNLLNIKWDEIDEAFPAFLTLILMPLTYSIANGIALGFITYPIVKIVRGKAKEVHPIMYVLFLVFLAHFIWLK